MTKELLKDSISQSVSGGFASIATAFVMESLSHMIPWLIATAAVITCDLVFGLRKSMMLGEDIRISKAIRRTMGKMVTYYSFVCMVCMVLLHIWLDCVTTYGTLIFLPFSAERVRLNAVFIIDFLLTLPLLWTVWRCRASRRRNYQDKRSALAAARLALLWVFVYPLLGAGLNALHTSHVTEALRADTSRRDAVLEEVVVLPDAFAPFFWRVIWQERPVGVSPAGADALLRADLPDSGSVVRTAGLDLLGRLRTPFSEPRPAMPRDAAAALASRSVEAGAFFEFALLPVLDTVPDADRNDMLASAVRQWRSYDLRFGSSLEFVRRLMSLRPNADIPFQFFFAVDADDQGAPRLDSVRLRFSDSRRDSGWRQPAEPRTVPLLRRLVGLR